MKNKTAKTVKFFILVLFITVCVIWGFIDKKKDTENVENNIAQKNSIVEENKTEEAKENPGDTLYKVIKVVDGDTIQIEFNGKKERLRFIGIDTPESVHEDETKNTENGRIASEYTKSLLEGKSVHLEFDVEERDQYGRLLAYVYLDGEMINKKLVKDGYAELETVPPNVKYVEEFKALLKEAKEEKRGLWGN